jgi:catechol 2,3-dioxygenase-like lactoylglutathione lyase family enzyme
LTIVYAYRMLCIDSRLYVGVVLLPNRVQLALNVSDVDAAVAFYGKLFRAEPAKRRPGYANFAIADPPLKLVLIEDPAARGAGVSGALNHLGVEVGSTDDVRAASGRLAAEGLATAEQNGVSCCYAVQDKVWVQDPDGAPWEVYTVLADVPADAKALRGCCTDSTRTEATGTDAVVPCC